MPQKGRLFPEVGFGTFPARWLYWYPGSLLVEAKLTSSTIVVAHLPRKSICPYIDLMKNLVPGFHTRDEALTLPLLFFRWVGDPWLSPGGYLPRCSPLLQERNSPR